MDVRTGFDIDCHGVIPECDFECSKCIAEIEATLSGMDGVSKVYMEGGAEEGRLIVEHDPGVATVELLIEAFETLPSFYEGLFVATVVES